MSSLRHFFLSARLCYRGLGLRDRRRLRVITNAGSRGLNTSLLPTTIKSGGNIIYGDDPISFKVWLKSLEIKGMDENKLLEFEKEENALIDMAHRGDPDNGIQKFAATTGISDEYAKVIIQDLMLSKYPHDFSWIKSWSWRNDNNNATTAAEANGGFESFIEEMEKIQVFHEGMDRSLELSFNESRRDLIKEYWDRAYDFNGRGYGMIPATIISGSSGLGKSVLAKAVCQLLPKYYPNTRCIYIPLNEIPFKVPTELNLYQIISHFIPNYNEQTSKEKVIVFVDEIHLAYLKKNNMISKPQIFIQSLLSGINRGTLIHFIGTSLMSEAFIKVDDQLFHTYKYYMERLNDQYYIDGFPSIKHSRLHRIGPLKSYHTLNEFKHIYSSCNNIDLSDINIQNKLNNVAVFAALKLGYWLTGGNARAINLLCAGEVNIEVIINATLDALETNEWFREIAKSICDKQDSALKKAMLGSDIFSTNSANPFDIKPCYLSLQSITAQNHAIMYNEKNVLHIEDDFISFSSPISLPIALSYFDEQKKAKGEWKENIKSVASQMSTAIIVELGKEDFVEVFKWMNSL